MRKNFEVEWDCKVWEGKAWRHEQMKGVWKHDNLADRQVRHGGAGFYEMQTEQSDAGV